jgi:hypothetical protein
VPCIKELQPFRGGSQGEFLISAGMDGLIFSWDLNERAIHLHFRQADVAPVLVAELSADGDRSPRTLAV